MLAVETLRCLQRKPRDPFCSCFVTIHSRHSRQRDRQTTSHDKSGTLQCNCKVPRNREDARNIMRALKALVHRRWKSRMLSWPRQLLLSTWPNHTQSDAHENRQRSAKFSYSLNSSLNSDRFGSCHCTEIDNNEPISGYLSGIPMYQI